MLVGERIEFLACLLVERSCSFEISALSVKDRDRGLDQSLVEKFHIAVGAFPDFFPGFVAFEEAAFVEEIDSLFEEICIVFSQIQSPSNLREAQRAASLRSMPNLTRRPRLSSPQQRDRFAAALC